jgi:hypothetical protein
MPQAVKWYRSAATQGHACAQLALAGCYFRGLGVTKDYVEAYKWLSLSAAQGVEESTKLLPILERMMTPEQVLEGRQRAEPLFNSKKAPVDDKADNCVQATPGCALLFILAQVPGAPDADRRADCRPALSRCPTPFTGRNCRRGSGRTTTER